MKVSSSLHFVYKGGTIYVAYNTMMIHSSNVNKAMDILIAKASGAAYYLHGAVQNETLDLLCYLYI